MAGFEHFDEQLDNIDREIYRLSLICRLDLNDKRAVSALLRENIEHPVTSEEIARQKLRGLLALHDKVKLEETLAAIDQLPYRQDDL
jgi:hypothetical protein